MRPLRGILVLVALLWLIIAGVWVGSVVVRQAKGFPFSGTDGEQLGAAAGVAVTWLFLSAVWCLPPIAMATVSLALRVFDDPPEGPA